MKIRNLQSLFCLATLLLLQSTGASLFAQRTEQSLGGEWNFALDPVDVGIEREWFKSDPKNWDKVQVPHCFTVDPRYHYFTGKAWYRRTFARPAGAESGSRTFLRFEAVFYRAQVWLNGVLIGKHEGGYTPFEIEIGDKLAADNLLVVQVDNSWNQKTVPGAKTPVPYQTSNYGQMYPWMNYGGITRAVSLVTRPSTYLDKVKIDARPDLAAKTAKLIISASVKSGAASSAKVDALKVTISRAGKAIPLSFRISGKNSGSAKNEVITTEAEMAASDVELWSFDHPVLYQAELAFGDDAVKAHFGIRQAEVRGTKFFLNGGPVALGGCNRPLDVPHYGSMDPQPALEHDLELIKSGGMELSRICHYPVSTELLNWADEHGLMLISEAGNWQLTPAQMADPEIREIYQSQLREMVERDWNHPSIIAWSMGNEFASNTPEGKAWTKDMRDFTKSLDGTRLITFASNMVARPRFTDPTTDAAQYVDFVSVNIYGHHLDNLRWIHTAYPDKPIYISEFGIRTDSVPDEQGRIDYLRKAMREMRECRDFLMGASVWTFNDYESLFPGTNANGYRPWGLVGPDRALRGMYRTWQEEFAPAVISTRAVSEGKVEVTVTARADLPSYTLRHYRLRARGKNFEIETLAPGEKTVFVVPAKSAETDANSAAKNDEIVLEKPGGFAVLSVPLNAAAQP
ncbi:MAG TPA: glycoside hydrolase family 2 TIM barrel-domain containing protein [Opitutaceae bacterium]|nr:glycoside hydrolase family 2 TIM barrel-domain containing protein [Opitutaceae bacterium]